MMCSRVDCQVVSFATDTSNLFCKVKLSEIQISHTGFMVLIL